MSTPTIVIDRPDVSANLDVVGTVPAAAAPFVTAREYGLGVQRQTVLECRGLPVSVNNGGSGAAWGSIKIYDFPLGRIAVDGCTANFNPITFSSGIAAGGSGDYSLGSTATADATLSGTEINFLPSTAMLDPFVAGVGRSNAGSGLAAVAQLDGTATAVDVFLNVTTDSGDTTNGATDTVFFTGRIVLTWKNLGDYSVT